MFSGPLRCQATRLSFHMDLLGEVLMRHGRSLVQRVTVIPSHRCFGQVPLT